MKNKITDLNIKQVKPKDSHFKEFKITYKYKGKPISDFRVFDKNISKSNDELLKTVTKEINDNLENGKLVKYALKFTGFTRMMTTICVVGGVGAATAVVVPTTMVLLNNSNNVTENLTLTLNAGDGYFGETTKKQYVISNIEPGKTLNEVLTSDDKYVDPTTDAKLTPQGETTPIPYYFVNYIDESGKEATDNFVINENVTLNANYDLQCLSFSVPEDSENDVVAFANVRQYFTPYVAPEIEYVSAANPSGPWSDFPRDSTSAITIHKGEKIYLKGNNPNGFSYDRVGGDWETNVTTFDLKSSVASGDATVNAAGNIMSLIDDGASNTTTIPSKGCFRYLFYHECQTLATAPSLPASVLKSSCYQYMFYCCTKLKVAPNLPANNIDDWSYFAMFRDCSSLEVAPVISATTCLSEQTGFGTVESCKYMFTTCKSLKVAPEFHLNHESLGDAANTFEGIYANCYKLEKLTVHFGVKDSTDWPEYENTKSWLLHAGEQAENQPVFEWHGASEGIPDNSDHVPQTRDGNPFWKIVTIEE